MNFMSIAFMQNLCSDFYPDLNAIFLYPQ